MDGTEAGPTSTTPYSTTSTSQCLTYPTVISGTSTTTKTPSKTSS